jgi:plastocyanin
MPVSERRRTAAVLAAAALLAGCSGGGAGSGSAAAAPVIDIKSFLFAPMTSTAKVGQMITVTNSDKAVHTLTAKDKSFDSKDLDQGQTYTFSVSKAGTYDYVCDIHQYMTGRITVP